MVLLEQVFRQASAFDLIHFHIDHLHFPLAVRQPILTVTTLHGRLDLPDLVPLYQMFPSIPVVSISDAQRAPLPAVHWLGTVYHGRPLYLSGDAGHVLVFSGAAPEGWSRRWPLQQVGMPLKIAAKVDPKDREYFREVVQPLLHQTSLVEYIGEVGGATKDAFWVASALLFPIDWPEPFGLVMIEAMACGTPVIAYPRGSVPEVAGGWRHRVDCGEPRGGCAGGRTGAPAQSLTLPPGLRGALCSLPHGPRLRQALPAVTRTACRSCGSMTPLLPQTKRRVAKVRGLLTPSSSGRDASVSATHRPQVLEDLIRH